MTTATALALAGVFVYIFAKDPIQTILHPLLRVFTFLCAFEHRS